MEEKKLTLKVSTQKPSKTPDSEALFRDLKNRDQNIQHLWSQQADILREYHNSLNDPQINTTDIALELPTGAGKTLVGMLIAEWRRRFYGGLGSNLEL